MTVRRRHVVANVGFVFQTLPDQHGSIGVGIGKRPEEQRIDDAEDADGRTKPHGKHQHRQRGEAGAAAEEPETVPDVVDEFRIAGELPPEPGGVVEGAEDAAQQVDLRPSVQFIPLLEPPPSFAHFPLPFLQPGRTVPGRDDAGGDAQDGQTDPEDQAGFHRLAMRGASASSARNRARASASRDSPAAVSS